MRRLLRIYCLSLNFLACLDGITTEIQNRLQSLYVPEESSSTAAAAELGVKLLHVWHTTPSTLRILNVQILPAVLAAVDPERVPAFSLGLGSIPSLGPIEYLKEFFNQIHTCFKSNIIIFLPSIDKLWASMDTRAKDIFCTQLELLRRKPVIVLTTATCDLKDTENALEFVDSGSSLQKSLVMRQPTAKEVSCYFQSLLASDAAHFGGNSRTNKYTDLLKELLADMEKHAPGKPLAKILNLYGTLSLLCKKVLERTVTRNLTAKDVRDLVNGFKDSVDNFKKEGP